MIENNMKFHISLKLKNLQKVITKKYKKDHYHCNTLPDDFVHYSQARSPKEENGQDFRPFQIGINLLEKEQREEFDEQGIQENLSLREKFKYTQIGNVVPANLKIGKHFKNY